MCILFFTFPKNIYDASVISFALQKTVPVDTRFSTDTDAMLFVTSFIHRMHCLPLIILPSVLPSSKSFPTLSLRGITVARTFLVLNFFIRGMCNRCRQHHISKAFNLRSLPDFGVHLLSPCSITFVGKKMYMYYSLRLCLNKKMSLSLSFAIVIAIR